VGAVEHPKGADQIILRMDEGGGFVPMGIAMTQTPQFSLYGDGTVIYSTGFAGMNGQLTIPALKKAHMTEEQIGKLVRFALEDGGLADAAERYEHPLVADAATTEFDIDAAGTTKSVSVYAVGLTDRDQPDWQARTRFNRLAEALRNFQGDVDRGQATAMGEYEPTSYRAVIVEGEVAGDQIDWPWPDLTPKDFPEDPTMGFRSKVISPEMARRITSDPRGGYMGIGTTGPDGKMYTIALRPLLPDETE
jgi:hypothetical protein